MPRIRPVVAPDDDAAGPLLTAMTPSGEEPIGLFRTFVRNPAMADAMRGWGGYELGPRLTLSLRARELVIHRTCARCGCEYEWGVHVAVFRERAGLDAAQAASLTHGSPDDPCWSDPSERCLIRAVDELHDGSTIGDATWSSLSASFRPDQLLDITLLASWYHAISYAANAADVELEPWAPRFADVAATSGP
jgi:alkylhydroperoxidase family enzyme